MARPLHILLLTTLCLLGACAPDRPALHEFRSGPLPPTATAGKWLVVNYWAEWCKPCREEIPELNVLQQRFPQKVVVAAINYDGLESAALAAAVKDFGIGYMVLDRDPHTALGYARPQQLPTTLLFDPEGTLKFVRVGPQTAAQLAQLMNLQAPAQSPR